MRFTDKRVLVVGGNSGIGLASARAFASEGARVAIAGRDPGTLESARCQIPGSIAVSCDIGKSDSLEHLISVVQYHLHTLDVLFINAGIGGFAALPEVTEAYWDQVHDTNLKGCFFALQKSLPLLNEGASVVITGSVGAVLAIPGNATYAAAKAGLRAAARVAAKELLPRKIRVNLVSPGPTETPLLERNPGMSAEGVASLRQHMIETVPMQRIARAEEIARAVLFLASDEASFITGVDLLVDGGCVEL